MVTLSLCRPDPPVPYVRPVAERPEPDDRQRRRRPHPWLHIRVDPHFSCRAFILSYVQKNKPDFLQSIRGNAPKPVDAETTQRLVSEAGASGDILASSLSAAGANPLEIAVC
jgi:hypothetical protein